MNNYFQTINAFLEDTSVIIVLAYLLARGPILDMLFQETPTRKRTLILCAIFTLIGLTEIVFPGARYPYVTSTLIITFAAFMVGLPTALLATCAIAVLSILVQSRCSGEEMAARSPPFSCHRQSRFNRMWRI